MLSRGEKLLRKITRLYFKGYKPKYNIRPKWLHSLELDIYYPSLKIAFEFQGEQHFGLSRFNDNSFEKLKKQVFNDLFKKQTCEKKNIVLFQVGTFELTTKRFSKMLDRMNISYNISHIKNHQTEKILEAQHAINESYRSFNGGRKNMSMKNPAARQGYLNSLLKMNPRNNRFTNQATGG